LILASTFDYGQTDQLLDAAEEVSRPPKGYAGFHIRLLFSGMPV